MNRDGIGDLAVRARGNAESAAETADAFSLFGARVVTEDSDQLIGSPLGDVLSGLGGDDRIEGRAGEDDMCGDAGDDRSLGEGGDDALRGGLGRDARRGAASGATDCWARRAPTICAGAAETTCSEPARAAMR